MVKPFSVETTMAPGHGAPCAVVTAGGAIDYTSSGAFRTELALALEGAREVVVDLGAVTFIDSSGLSVLISGYKQARRGAVDYRLRNLTPSLSKLLTITGLSRVFSVEPSSG